jgi:DNA-binding XRE family transcriptional regulator
MTDKAKLTPNVLKSYSLDEIEDKYIGKKGTAKRDIYEFELQLDLLGDALKKIRKNRDLTQEQLGELLGVDKSQISKLEKNASHATLATIMKVFHALEAKVELKVMVPNGKAFSHK